MSDSSASTFALPAGIEASCRRIDLAARSALGDSLVGTYLHGSAVLGGFVQGRSDVDVLIVVARAVVDGIAELATRLPELAGGCPGRGIELSIVVEADVRAPASPWPFVVHVTTAPDDDKVVFGGGGTGDPDLLMHYVVCRAAGVALSGPPPAQLFGAIDRADVLGYLADELDWAISQAPTTYAVLNACRAWRYLETGEVVSKLDGADWARGRAPDALLDAAVAHQTGDTEVAAPHGDTLALVGQVRRRLLAALAPGQGDP